MGDACDDEGVMLLRGRRRHQGVVAAEGGRCDGGGGWVSGSNKAVSSGSSSSSLFSSTSSLTDDEEEDGDAATSSSTKPDRDVSSSSSLSSLTSSGSETTQMGAGGGPLYALSDMMKDLPALRTGLSKYYQGRSQSFTSLANVSCVEDLAKKTTPYIRRKKASSRCPAEVLGAKNRLSKTIAKKAPRSKPTVAYQGKRDVQMLGHCKMYGHASEMR